MSKRSRVQSEDNGVADNGSFFLTENHVQSVNNDQETVVQEPVIQEPVIQEPLAEDDPVIVEKNANIATLKTDLEAIVAQVKTKKTEIRNLEKEVAGLLKGEKVKVKTVHKTIFVSNGIDVKEMLTKKNKALSYQGRLLVEMFIGSAPAGTEIEYTSEEILKKLEDYPCLGDKMDNFSWYKSQVFKPMGLVK